MPGLNLGITGGVKASAQNGNTYQQQPATAAEAGFGPGYTMAGTPSTVSALAPNDPFGMAFTAGVIAFGLLFLIRHSLPR